MNIYEEAELEARDLTCELCLKTISVKEYTENSGFCDECFESLTEQARFMERGY